MATIRQWLDAEGFNWTTGRIIYQPTGDNFTPGWSAPAGAEQIGADHPILDHEFYDGHGGPECPRFIAEDAARIYFPNQYDGATSIVAVWKDLARYLEWQTTETPYPGG